MFERLQKPFLTVETGEAYQPIRLSYTLQQKDQLFELLKTLKCVEPATSANTWNWYWRDECDQLQFDSIDSFKRNPKHPVRLGTLTVRDDALYINLPSFKRACLATPFFHRLIKPEIARIDHTDFINKVFGLDERLPHGFSELFDENELDKILQERMKEYALVQSNVEHAETAEEALKILTAYTQKEASKRLPYAERYHFEHDSTPDSDVLFLGFYIFLRGRELVAIRRWYGDAGYTLAQAADETVEKVFGGMNIDMIE